MSKIAEKLHAVHIDVDSDFDVAVLNSYRRIFDRLMITITLELGQIILIGDRGNNLLIVVTILLRPLRR